MHTSWDAACTHYDRYRIMEDNKRKREEDKEKEKGKEKVETEDEDTLGESTGDDQVPPKKRFRLNAKTLFLTYPKCPIEPAIAKEELVEKLGEPEEFIVAQEKHQVRTPSMRSSSFESPRVNTANYIRNTTIVGSHSLISMSDALLWGGPDDEETAFRTWWRGKGWNS